MPRPYIQFIKNPDEILRFIRQEPKLFLLLSIVAQRAKRDNKEISKRHLEIGEAEIDGHKETPFTRQEYRSLLKKLETLEFATIKTTNKGVRVKLINKDVFDINEAQSNHQATTRKRQKGKNATIKTTIKESAVNQTNKGLFGDDETQSNHQNNHQATIKQPSLIYKEGKEGKEVPYRLSTLLYQLILDRKGDYREPDLEKWAVTVDRMIRLDKREPEVIEAVIRWSQADDFWQNNILSTAKLRKQFDQLELKMKADPSFRKEEPKQCDPDWLPTGEWVEWAAGFREEKPAG